MSNTTLIPTAKKTVLDEIVADRGALVWLRDRYHRWAFIETDYLQCESDASMRVSKVPYLKMVNACQALIESCPVVESFCPSI